MTKALPNPDLKPNLWTIDVKPGDRLVVASDGAYGSVDKMEQVLTDPANQDADKAAHALVQAAKSPQGQLNDDATAVVINL
jgi:serine/threonine protein phosphatase PrpC